jgi:elongation factor P--(R)-beta-lysine ligase
MKRNWEKYWIRERVIDSIREYFKNCGFHEVTTPLLLPTVSTEPFLEVFETTMTDDRGNERQMFLPTSPEFSMKKMLCEGSGSIFQITSSFRNGEGKSPRHSPEFSILEWYEVGGDYMSVAREMQSLMLHIRESVSVDAVNSVDSVLEYQGKEYDLGGEWEKISVKQAFEKYAGIEEDVMLDEEKLKEKASEKGYQVSETTTWEEVWNQIMANEIEPELGKVRPTVLYDYPIAQAALAKKCCDPRYAERAEVYLAGMELANIFSELTDWEEQEARCKADLLERKKLGKTEYPMDTEFIEALKSGMPETGGIAVGVDRLVMLFSDAKNIREIREII